MQKEKEKEIELAKYHCKIAQVIAYKSTCIDKQVGCVITDKHNTILSTGYNGSPKGYAHCTDAGYCAKDRGGICLAVHAEINAIIKCPDIQVIKNIYLTISPCLECFKVILNTGCTHIYYIHLSRQFSIWQNRASIKTMLQNRQYITPLIITQVITI